MRFIRWKSDDIFCLGNGLDNNVILYLKDGELKLSLQLGSGQLKTGVSKVLFNDSEWHKVHILRRAEKVGLLPIRNVSETILPAFYICNA